MRFIPGIKTEEEGRLKKTAPKFCFFFNFFLNLFSGYWESSETWVRLPPPPKRCHISRQPRFPASQPPLLPKPCPPAPSPVYCPSRADTEAGIKSWEANEQLWVPEPGVRPARPLRPQSRCHPHPMAGCSWGGSGKNWI